jgi:hypothetical protein
MRADIHGGQEHKRSVRGPDTEAQDLFPPFLTSGLQSNCEQMLSGLPLIVLQKSFCTVDRKFFGL